ncbi:MAG TPA: hypothetical protein VGE52_04710, partial [Pirellulales bacterium]
AGAEIYYFYQKGWLTNSMEFAAPPEVQAAAAAKSAAKARDDKNTANLSSSGASNVRGSR